MGNLRPVAIVDKNGRATTVHRRGDSTSPAGTSPPAPKLGPQNGIQGTPLTPIAPATRSESRKIIKELTSGERYWNAKDDEIAKELDKRQQALIRRLLDNPDISRMTIESSVQYGVWDDSVTKDELTNSLLVLEHMYTHGDGSLLETAGISAFFNAVLGADQVGSRPYLDKAQPITTREELESKSAFVAFVLLAEQNSLNDDSIVNRKTKRFNFKWYRDFIVIQNQHLRKLVMERPDKQHEITDYVRARGMHPKNKKPVDALRTYLDDTGETVAVNVGWL